MNRFVTLPLVPTGPHDDPIYSSVRLRADHISVIAEDHGRHLRCYVQIGPGVDDGCFHVDMGPQEVEDRVNGVLNGIHTVKIHNPTP